MTLASLSLDSIADLLANGADAYMFFAYQSNAAWQAITGSTSRFHLPIWYAISMFNSACADKSLVQTKFPEAVPTLTTVARDKDGNRIDGEAVPAISVRSDLGKGQASFLRINGSALVSYPVVLKMADNAVSYRVVTLATDGAERGTLEGPGLVPTESSPRDLSKIFEVAQPTVRELKSADGDIRITLPPASVVTVEQTR